VEFKIKKGKDLKPGDIAKDWGVFTEINLNSDPEGFWDGKPNLTYLCYHDSYHGPLCGEFDVEKDFEIYTDRKSIIKILKRIDSDLAKYIADTMQVRKDFQELKMEVVTRLNNE